MTDNTSADEILDLILQCLGVVDRETGERPGQIQTVRQLITSYTKQRELALLERLFDDEKINFSGGRLNYIVPKSAIRGEKEKL